MSKILKHETSVQAVVTLDRKGDIVICGLPGLVIGRDGGLNLDPEHADLTFEYLNCLGVNRLYLLMEDIEIPSETRPLLESIASAHAISLEWLPIVDCGRPDQVIEDVWKSDRLGRQKMLHNKKNIGVACLYGAGRSGMMAASIVAEAGVDPKKAVRYVRKFFAEAVGSKDQERWVAEGTYLH